MFFLSIGLSDSFTTSTSTTRTNSHNLLLLHLRREELVTPPSLCTEAKETRIDGAFTSLTNRRQLLSQTVSSLLLGTIAAVAGTSTAATISSPCWAADNNNTPKTTSDTLWLTGKPPQKPGQSTTTKKSDSSVAGTRKDPNFLRSMADCRNQCENTVDADGYPRQRDECLATCQDVCCTTYEQCTASVKIR